MPAPRRSGWSRGGDNGGAVLREGEGRPRSAEAQGGAGGRALVGTGAQLGPGYRSRKKSISSGLPKFQK